MKTEAASSLRTRFHRPLGTILIAAGLLLAESETGRGHGDVHESIVAVTAEIEKNPQQPELYIRRGALHRAHQDWPAALADFERAHKLAPAQVELSLARGELLTELARFPEAETLLGQFRDAHPQNPRGWAALGRLNAQQLKWDAAATDYGKAVEFTQPPDPHLFLLQTQALRASGKLDEALAVLEQGIAQLGNLPVLVQPAVEVAIVRRDWGRAEKLLDTAAAASIRKERWLMKKAEVYELAGRKAEALATFRQALAEFETLPPNRRAVAAMIAFEQGLRTSIQRLEKDSTASANPGPN